MIKGEENKSLELIEDLCNKLLIKSPNWASSIPQIHNEVMDTFRLYDPNYCVLIIKRKSRSKLYDSTIYMPDQKNDN